MIKISALISLNAERWAKCQITSSRLNEVLQVSRRLIAPMAKARYLAVQEATNVPWHTVARIHEREASQRWDRQLGQGDPLGHVSVNVPAGRGPFLHHDGDVPGADAWHRAALDALIDCPPHLAAWKDWSAGGMLTAELLYNGIGKEPHASPYVWGATNIQTRGKYIRDRVYDPMAWDMQLGCAAMLKGMMQLDPSIKLETNP